MQVAVKSNVPWHRDMLEFAGDGDPRQRLSCQMLVTDELDELVVRTPESQ